MSSSNPSAGKPNPKDAPSTELISNPFDTLFDGDESEDEWWDEEEDSIFTTQKTTTTAGMAQWPGNVEGADAGSVPKPPRTSPRKPDKRYSVQKPTRNKSKGRVKKQTAKAGIKVVTTFSRQGAGPQPVSLQPPKTMPQTGCFVDLAALQALNGESIQTSGSFWKRKKDLARTTDTMPSVPSNAVRIMERRQSQSLVPSPIRSHDELSPNDRPIVIGLSIPSDDVAEHTLSPQTATSDLSRIVRSYEHRTPTSYAPDTPTIIITPAQESPSWSPLEANSASQSRHARAASSIYSQSPHNAMGIYTDRNAPPIPQMPASVLEQERQRVAAQRSYFSPDSEDGTGWGNGETEHASSSKSRVVSSCTLFEEDESPIVARKGRAISISTKSIKHASINTVATRRSTGWWNYITTPFLTRSNTAATGGVFEDQQAPALPSLALAAAKAEEAQRDRTSWEKQFSPLTPETTITERPESWWQSDLKDEQAKDLNSEEPPPMLHETRHKAQRSSGTIPFVLSEVAVITVPTMSSVAAVNSGSTTDRGLAGLSLARSASGLSSSDAEVTILSNAPNTRRLQTHNPYTQPSLGDLSDSANQTRSATQQLIQPVRAAIVQAPSRPQQSPGDAPPPPYSPSPSRVPLYRAILPPENPSNPANLSNLQYPVSPGPLSPGMQQAMSGGSGIPMSNVPLTTPPRRAINLNSGYSAELPARDRAMPVTTEFLQPPKKAQKAESKRRRHEKEDATARKAGGWWRGRGCIPDRGCYGRSGAEGRKRRRWYIGLTTGFITMMIVVIALATTLHRKTHTVIGPSQWVNLTGFPPIFTGLSTVAAPVNIVTNTGCVFPATQWSCDLPKELQASVAPNQPSQPNFLLNIQWDNSSSTNTTFANVTGNPNLVTRAGNAVSAGQLIKRVLLKSRQIVSFSPNPAPPSYAENFFLGNTTDSIVSADKAGEPTPFYISFVQPTNSSSNTKRQVQERTLDPFPNVTDIIPAPSLNKDGTSAPANLLPLPSQQPVKLYDRGLPTEHYGFYTYFDRSIFLKSIKLLNSTDSADGEVPDDQNGGATEVEAAFRCTWAQTRFLVQIWTRMNSTARLNNATSTVSTSVSPGNDFTQPGSFPYPITITTDRHGGDPALKMLYCYEMDDREGIVKGSGQINAENRGFGGTVINPAPSVFANSSNPALGGFDGGTGGCSCSWSNFGKVTNT
ncbi:hypothetical protein D0Z07_5638 [Hyphodiscus hymeniophilus]|uniref:Glycoprotease family protein n=1 Tax=Hyphodiscus hymeniophilus TaxID=353542 RepID=A0A9P6VI44_9HELO|nr:hypothetical protein D0Z07_5638 [Hyphodiscus hymeniophilus]